MTTLADNLLSRKRPCECCYTPRAAVWIKLSHAGLRDDSEAVAHDVHEQDGWVACKAWIEDELEEFEFTLPFHDSVLEELNFELMSNSVSTKGADHTIENMLEAQRQISDRSLAPRTVTMTSDQVDATSHVLTTANTGADAAGAIYMRGSPATRIALSQDGQKWDRQLPATPSEVQGVLGTEYPPSTLWSALDETFPDE